MPHDNHHSTHLGRSRDERAGARALCGLGQDDSHAPRRSDRAEVHGLWVPEELVGVSHARVDTCHVRGPDVAQERGSAEEYHGGVAQGEVPSGEGLALEESRAQLLVVLHEGMAHRLGLQGDLAGHGPP